VREGPDGGNRPVQVSLKNRIFYYF